MLSSAAALLARAAKHTRWTDLPPDVRDQAADLILDTIAVIAAGMAQSEYARFAEAALRDSGKCTVIGKSALFPATTAAQVHGGATTVLQLQDGHRMARGHPASHIVPAALAIAEDSGASGEDFLSAFVGGYEASVRVGLALGGLRPEIHDTGTWSTVGPAVAAALLMGADAEQLRHAIEGAATVSILPWSRTAPEGATMHHLFIGLAASMGLIVATAAMSGLLALPRTVEDFFIPRAGAAPDLDRLTQNITADGHWATFEMMNAYLKLHPTCAHLHGVNDAVDALMREDGLKGIDVATADIAICAAAMAYDAHNPTTELAARFSVAYTVAIALLRGGLEGDAISQSALNDPQVQNLAGRIAVRHDPELDQYYPGGRPAVVTVTLHNGTRQQRRVIHPRGDCTSPSSRAERRAKANKLLAALFGASQAATIVRSFDALVAGGVRREFHGDFAAHGGVMSTGSSSTHPAATLAAFVHGLRFENLGSAVVERAVLAVGDTLACILAGSRLPEVVGLHTLAPTSERGATVIGTPLHTSAEFAALANGTAGISLELDEGNQFALNHPSMHILPAALAMAEAKGRSGREFLTAYIAGYEVAARVGRATHLRDAVHPFGTHAIVGAAAAVAKLLDLSREKTAEAMLMAAGLAIASSQTAANAGASVRNVITGLTNANAILAVKLTQVGFGAEPAAFDVVFGKILGDAFDGATITIDPLDDYFLLRNYFKVHACSRWNHAPIEAAIAALGGRTLALSEIAEVTVWTFNPATRLHWPCPSNSFAAKHSIPTMSRSGS